MLMIGGMRIISSVELKNSMNNYDIFYTNTLIFYEKNKRFAKYKDIFYHLEKYIKILQKNIVLSLAD